MDLRGVQEHQRHAVQVPGQRKAFGRRQPVGRTSSRLSSGRSFNRKCDLVRVATGPGQDGARQVDPGQRLRDCHRSEV